MSDVSLCLDPHRLFRCLGQRFAQSKLLSPRANKDSDVRRSALSPIFISRHAPPVFGANIRAILDEGLGDSHTFSEKKWRHTSIAASVNTGHLCQ